MRSVVQVYLGPPALEVVRGPASTKPAVLSGVGEVGELAQMGERLLCTQEVTGSNPVFSTKFEVETEVF